MKAAAGPPSKKSFGAPYTLEVWASVMDKSKGRDKVLVSTTFFPFHGPIGVPPPCVGC
jgi:hypothetical protein